MCVGGGGGGRSVFVRAIMVPDPGQLSLVITG